MITPPWVRRTILCRHCRKPIQLSPKLDGYGPALTCDLCFGVGNTEALNANRVRERNRR